MAIVTYVAKFRSSELIFKGFLCESSKLTPERKNEILDDVAQMNDKLNGIVVTVSYRNMKVSDKRARGEALLNGDYDYFNGHIADYLEEISECWTNVLNDHLHRILQEASENEWKFERYHKSFYYIWELFVTQDFPAQLQPEITGDGINIAVHSFDEQMFEKCKLMFLSQDELAEYWEYFVSKIKSLRKSK